MKNLARYFPASTNAKAYWCVIAWLSCITLIQLALFTVTQ